jgi:hypothetical protein
MTTNRQKRSSFDGMAPGHGHAQGVGGRQQDAPPPARGGGYPDICTAERSPVGDPRLAELRAVGLAPHWLRVAEEIGVDNFLVTWLVLDETAPQDDHGRVVVPPIGNYLRHQRNKYIATLAACGSTAGEIRQVLRKRLGYDLTEDWIRKLIRESR